MATPLTRDELIERLVERRTELANWFAARTPEELERPLTESEIPGGEKWNAKDHLAHAIGTERYLTGVAKRTLDGAEDPAGFYTQIGDYDRESLMRVINKANQASHLKYHSATIDSLLTRMQETREATLAMLTAMNEEQLDYPSPHSPFGRGSVRDIFRQIAHHDQEHLRWLTTAFTTSEPSSQGDQAGRDE